MMKIEDILTVLKTNTTISDYEINHQTKHSSELFFVKKKMELNRVVHTENITVTIYKDVEDKRGSSVVVVTSADDVASFQKKIDSAISKAATALNPWFPLAQNQQIYVKTDTSISLNDIALEVGNTIMQINQENGWLNATEIFVSITEDEFLNSNDVKDSQSKLSIEFETIPTCSDGKEEYELYKYYRNNQFDAASIEKEIKDILSLASLRGQAKKLNEINIDTNVPIYMYGDMNNLIVNNIKENTSYLSNVTHSNHYECNHPVSNTPFDLILKGSISGASASSHFDEHGVVLKEIKIIEDGVCKQLHGDIQYGYYLKQECPTGSYPVAELITKQGIDTNEPHLIIDYFSAPQLEKESGYFGGEVRLARYFDGEKYIPLTGFSISGNVYEAMNEVGFSKEETVTRCYKGPKYFKFKNLVIS